MNMKPFPEVTGLFAQPVTFSFLIDEIPLGVIVLDRERRVLLFNRAIEGLTGFERREAKGIPCSYVMRGNLCLERCPVCDLGDGAEPISMEGNIINRERQKIPVRITVAPIKDISGDVTGFIETVEDIRALRTLDGKIGNAYGFGRLIGCSPQMERLFQILPVVAQSDSSVLITGETGTGKDLLAEAIHQGSVRAKQPFIKVNCGALPETLLESELFGHQKGAFTGAVENKPGRFRLAHNGTLYLTEIGDLPLSLQVKLLTFLDDKIVHPLGSARGYPCNVRVIAATHRNLEQMVRDGRFREDLLFRLNVVRLQLPPLRERGDDVRLLLDHFIQSYIAKLKKPIKGVSAKALRHLLDYSYPGNVRELRNIVEYASNICQEDLIQLKHLPAYLTEPAQWERKPDVEKDDSSSLANEARREKDQDLDWAAMERRMIMEALVKAKGRRSKAAALLGWGRSTLWRKMKQYGLDS